MPRLYRHPGDRFLAVVWILLVVAIILGSLWAAWILLTPLLVGTMLATIIAPAVDTLYRRGLPRSLASFLVLGSLLALFTTLLVLTAPLLREQAHNFISHRYEYATAIVHKLDGLFDALGRLLPHREMTKARRALSHAIASNRSIFSSLDQLFGLLPLIENMLLSGVVAFFVLAKGLEIRRWMVSLVPNRYFEMTLRLMYRVQQQAGSYIRGQSADSAINAGLVSLALWILGVPYAGFIGIFAGIANAVPLLGPIAGGTPAILLCLLGACTTPWWVVALTLLALHMLDNMVIYPATVGKSLHIPPLVVILGIAVGGNLGGILGMLVAIPLLGLLRGLIAEFHESLKGHKIL